MWSPRAFSVIAGGLLLAGCRPDSVLDSHPPLLPSHGGLAATALSGPRTANAVVQYLGQFNGPGEQYALGVNASGLTVGMAWAIATGDAYGRGALKFEPIDTIPGTPPDTLGTCASGFKHPTRATSINDGGLIVGDGTGPCNSGIYVSQWPATSITWLPPSTASPYWFDESCCINNVGDVAGSYSTSGSPNGPYRRPGLWRPNGLTYSFTDIGLLNDDNYGVALGMSPSGSGAETIVVGYSLGPSSGPHAWSWHNGVLTMLLGDSLCAPGGQAHDVTDAGVVVGVNGCGNAAVWSNGEWTDISAICLSLGGPGGNTAANSIAVTPNGRTIIAGSCGGVPVVWYDDGHGGYDAELLPLLVGDSDGDAVDVNGAGFIVGYSGCLFVGCGNDRKPVRWTFTPPPINNPPTADAGGPYSSTEGSLVSFTGAGSSDPENTALTYDWDFGDGSAHGTGVAPTHAYADNGSYNVTLTVSDGKLANSISTTSAVANVVPTVTLTLQTAPPIHAGQNFVVRGGFHDVGLADGPWAYKFFRNNTLLQQGSKPNQPPPGATQPVTLKLNTVGTYTLKLQVTDKDGGVGTASIPVQVVP